MPSAGFFPTGLPGLDKYLAPEAPIGGIPWGSVVVITGRRQGPKAPGKSILARYLASRSTDNCYIDSGYNASTSDPYVIYNPETFEEALSLAKKRASCQRLVVIDSLQGLPIDRETELETPAAEARTLTSWLSRIHPLKGIMILTWDYPGSIATDNRLNRLPTSLGHHAHLILGVENDSGKLGVTTMKSTIAYPSGSTHWLSIGPQGALTDLVIKPPLTRFERISLEDTNEVLY